jgi:2-polyprenyl-6-methoxyphenol hydroxylase-like FAD-dependent oxidoreductase
MTDAGTDSKSREAIVRTTPCAPVPLPDLTYRATILRKKMLNDSNTTEMTSQNSSQLCLGPKRAVVAYPVFGGNLYSIAITTVHGGNGKVGKWDDAVGPEDLLSVLKDFCPQVQRLRGLVDACAKWTIAEVPELDRLSSSSGRSVLLGDSAHAMSPHLAQGCAMAFEDAAVLGRVLSTSYIGQAFATSTCTVRASPKTLEFTGLQTSLVAMVRQWFSRMVKHRETGTSNLNSRSIGMTATPQARSRR